MGECAGICNVNPVSRIITTINGMQSRALRAMGLVSLLATALAIVGSFEIIKVEVSWADPWQLAILVLLTLSAASIFACIISFALSMRQICVSNTIKKDDESKDTDHPSKTVEAWKRIFLSELAKLERWYIRGTTFFFVGVCCLAIAPLIQLIASFFPN